MPFAEHCVYRTSTPPELLAPAAAEVVHQALLGGEAAAAALTLVFFSPSGVEALVPYVTKSLAGFSSTRLRLVALGATTGEKDENRLSCFFSVALCHSFSRRHVIISILACRPLRLLILQRTLTFYLRPFLPPPFSTPSGGHSPSSTTRPFWRSGHLRAGCVFCAYPRSCGRGNREGGTKAGVGSRATLREAEGCTHVSFWECTSAADL